MIVWVNSVFIEWAAWVKDGSYLPGWGQLVIAKVLEGKGEILPRATYCHRRGSTEEDKRMMLVERFIGGLTKRDRRLVKVFYLVEGNGEWKAKVLGLDRRTMYGRLHRIHAGYVIYKTSFTSAQQLDKL